MIMNPSKPSGHWTGTWTFDLDTTPMKEFMTIFVGIIK